MTLVKNAFTVEYLVSYRDSYRGQFRTISEN